MRRMIFCSGSRRNCRIRAGQEILERSRRGRRHAARSGSVSALTGAPFGYRYVSRIEGGGVARFEVVEAEAHIVRLIFAWSRPGSHELARSGPALRQMGCETRKGASYWYASTIRSMLDNPAYVGRATFGRSRFLPPRPRLRPIRGHLKPSPRATSRVPVPREEWIEIPVPPLVDPTMFEAVRAQLEENRSLQTKSRTQPSLAAARPDGLSAMRLRLLWQEGATLTQI